MIGRIGTILTAIGLGLTASPLLAQTASSSAFAVDANQTVTSQIIGTATVDLDPVAAVSWSAPNVNVTNSVASLNQSFVVGSHPNRLDESFSAGLVETYARGNSLIAQSGATAYDFQFYLGTTIPFIGFPFPSDLLIFNAARIQSLSQANSVDGLDASGGGKIFGGALYGPLLGELFFGSTELDAAAPNTNLFDSGGLTIILNEQILSGNGVTDVGITTNAIAFRFNNFATNAGVMNGSVIIGSSQAFASLAAPVPEPSTWAMLIIGFGAIGVATRASRRRQCALAAA